MVRNLKKIFIFYFVIFIFALLFFTLQAKAKVTGECYNCHTMHNSQGGQPMTFNKASNPVSLLLRGTCLGCHGQYPTGGQYIIGNIPQVLHASSTDLPAGNFAYITGNKPLQNADSNTAGHNVIDLGVQETKLTSPPGDINNTGITNQNFTCAGIYGCHGDRTIQDPYTAMRGAHHTDDSPLKFGSINLSGQGDTVGTSYRFLKGVKGGEVSWSNYPTPPYDHNEYYGDTTPGTSSATAPANNTISGLCAECHGAFYGSTNVGSSSPWLRHPTDTVLPNAYEYANYTTYSVVAPVARTSSWSGWSASSPSTTVTPGSDVIMCLSCHYAHASPYFKSMRWDYKGWPGSGGTNGCNVCHTKKN